MPLKKSSSDKAFEDNLKELVKAGHPIKQALAIAFKTQREAKAKEKESPKRSKGSESDN